MNTSESELDKLERLAKSFGGAGVSIDHERNSDFQSESGSADLYSRIARVNEILRRSLNDRDRLANYLNSILESLDSGVIVTDQNGIITIFNEAAEQYTGVKAQDALGSEYFAALGVAALKDASRIFTGERSAVTGEKEFRLADGSVVSMAYSLTRLRQIGGAGTAGMVKILYNLAETRKLESNIKRISTLAALGEMAATVAHEIKNPIAGIAGFTSLLLRDIHHDDANRRLVEKIRGGVESLEAIVSSLLDFTKDVSPEHQKTELVSLLNETVSDFKTVDNHEKHTIVVECGSRKLSTRLDPHLFKQIVLNLIKNAIQVQPEGGTVQITLSGSESAGAILTVEDSGPGISDDHFDKLFTPFFTTRTSGTGLGLATVRKLVELHGGTVIATNRPDGGAAFKVEIPGFEGGLSEAQDSDS
jgi:PAS domain S-box-containing protein